MSARLRVGILALACAIALGVCSSGSDTTARGTTTIGPTATTTTPTTPEKTVPTLPARLDNGANGLPQLYPPGHMAPTRACGDRVRATPKSVVTRVLPDGPRRPNGSLAFASGVCVYLPPGYVTSGLRYPVLYLLHGGGGDEADAVTFGHIRQLMDDRIAQSPTNAMIVVMPDGDTGHWYDSINGSFQIERYVISSVVPYIDQNFRTIDTRTAARAIDGVSNGGLGAMTLAAKHPALFGVAGGMSSNLDALTLPGLGDRNGGYFWNNHPIDLVAGLDHTPIILDVASRCTSTVPADLCISQRVDQAFLPANRAFVAALRARPQRHAVLAYREINGAHQWIWWNRTLRDQHLAFFAAHLTDPERNG